MDDSREPDSMPGNHAVRQSGAEPPEMPVPPSETLWRGGDPYLIAEQGLKHTLGWHDTRKGGPCFVLARLTFAVKIKVLDRFPLTEEGWAQAWAALVKLDASAVEAVGGKVREMAAESAARQAETARQAQMFEALAHAERWRVFQRLSVRVLETEGTVYTLGTRNPQLRTDTSRLLGPLAGAEAMVTDGSQAWSPARAMLMPIALTALAAKAQADAAVVFPDGFVHTAPLDGNLAVREAQKQAVQFNALAGAAAPAQAHSDPVSRMRKLQDLIDTGLITQEEYDAKRAEIINSI